MTSFNDRRQERLRLEHCMSATKIQYVHAMGNDTYLVEDQGEISLLDRDSFRSLLKQLAGKDVLP